mgnify:CR=1 FL=1
MGPEPGPGPARGSAPVGGENGADLGRVAPDARRVVGPVGEGPVVQGDVEAVLRDVPLDALGEGHGPARAGVDDAGDGVLVDDGGDLGGQLVHGDEVVLVLSGGEREGAPALLRGGEELGEDRIAELVVVGLAFVATPDSLSFTNTTYQYIGAVIISASFALSNNSRPVGLLITGASGLLGYYVLLAVSELGLIIIPANAVAGFTVGFTATVVSRLTRIPSQAIIDAGIVPLVPGLTLYNGLMALVANPAAVDGTLLLMRAILIAVAIAAGASFGVLIGRPTRRSLVTLRNNLPEHPLRSNQKQLK